MSLETKFKTEQRTEHQDSTLNNTQKPKSQFDKNKFQQNHKSTQFNLNKRQQKKV